ncbi:MAG: hypothetical protein HFJ85_01440 [Oscillospiraceae bacterium]|nr:hypothetical protein [Oscillospiraceae bacterium]
MKRPVSFLPFLNAVEAAEAAYIGNGAAVLQHLYWIAAYTVVILTDAVLYTAGR